MTTTVSIVAIFCFLLVAGRWPATLAAHSRRRVTVVRQSKETYDRSITTFDPSGRLLQVEYGMNAAGRGSPIAAVLTQNGTLYVAVVSSRRPPQATQQPRLEQVYRIDHHIFLFASGLSGDARALATSLRNFCQRHRLSMGEAPTVREVAETAAAWQHQLTRTGGARPLGCTAIIAGVNQFHSASSSSSSAAKERGGGGDLVRLYRTDPGGILEDCLYCVAGKNQDTTMRRLMEQYDELSTSDRPDILKSLVSILKEGSDVADDDDFSVDVWDIDYSPKRRGKISTTCVMNLSDKVDT